MTGPWASHLVLRDPSVDAAVLETARGGIVRAGLGWRKCKVGAVLNVASDHLGMGGINDLDELAEVKRVVVEVAQDWCVLNADDERVAPMAEHSPGKPIYVTMQRENELVRRHIRDKGRAVALEEGLNGRHDRALRGGGADPAAVGAADPGDGRGARDPQRPERHVRHRDRPRDGDQPGEHPPGPAHLHHRLLPDPGPDELLQRAPLPRAARLRPQRPRHDGHGADHPRAHRERPADRRPRRARATAATRTSSSSPAPPPRPSTSSSCARTTTCRGRSRGDTGALVRQGLLAAGFPGGPHLPRGLRRGGGRPARPGGRPAGGPPGHLRRRPRPRLAPDRQLRPPRRSSPKPASHATPIFAGNQPPLASAILAPESPLDEGVEEGED